MLSRLRSRRVPTHTINHNAPPIRLVCASPMTTITTNDGFSKEVILDLYILSYVHYSRMHIAYNYDEYYFARALLPMHMCECVSECMTYTARIHSKQAYTTIRRLYRMYKSGTKVTATPYAVAEYAPSRARMARHSEHYGKCSVHILTLGTISFVPAFGNVRILSLRTVLHVHGPRHKH